MQFRSAKFAEQMRQRFFSPTSSPSLQSPVMSRSSSTSGSNSGLSSITAGSVSQSMDASLQSLMGVSSSAIGNVKRFCRVVPLQLKALFDLKAKPPTFIAPPSASTSPSTSIPPSANTPLPSGSQLSASSSPSFIDPIPAKPQHPYGHVDTPYLQVNDTAFVNYTIPAGLMPLVRDKSFTDFNPDHSPLLGSGGFSKVYAVHVKETGAEVALKVAKQNLTRATFEEIIHEAMLMKMQSDQTRAYFVNMLFIIYENNQPPQIVMERMIASVFDLIHPELHSQETNRTLLGGIWVNMGLRDRCFGLAKVAIGLQALHTCNTPLLHRDIKSLNIMVGRNSAYAWKIGDLGCSQLIASNATREDRKIVGTYAWMAPELLEAEMSSTPLPYTTASDIYSYGVFAWEVISEQIPWKDTNGKIVEEINFHLTHKTRRNLATDLQLMRDKGTVHGKLADMIEGCCSHEANRRPTTVEVVDMIYAALQAASAGSTPDPACTPIV